MKLDVKELWGKAWSLIARSSYAKIADTEQNYEMIVIAAGKQPAF